MKETDKEAATYHICVFSILGFAWLFNFSADFGFKILSCFLIILLVSSFLRDRVPPMRANRNVTIKLLYLWNFFIKWSSSVFYSKKKKMFSLLDMNIKHHMIIIMYKELKIAINTIYHCQLIIISFIFFNLLIEYNYKIFSKEKYYYKIKIYYPIIKSFITFQSNIILHT